MSYNNNCYRKIRNHNHEFLGSTKLAEIGDERHNHRFAGVSSLAIRCGNSHYHILETTTDSVDHIHKICTKTGPAVYLENGEHIHYVEDVTSCNDGHSHCFEVATLLSNSLV